LGNNLNAGEDNMRFGMDFGGTNIKCGVFSEQGEVQSFTQTELKTFTANGDLLQNLIEHSQKMCHEFNIKKGGLAIKGLVNTASGSVEEDIGAGSLLAGKPLRDAFSRTLGFPFFVENDARAYAWGEWKFGAGRGSRVMVCMTLGTGLGCALVVDQKPYEGSDPLGGILGGHISIDHKGKPCPCGNRGCLEMYCSATAFTERVMAAHPELAGHAHVLPQFFADLLADKPDYQKTLREFQEDLAVGIVNVIHAYGPDVVVLGGGVMNSHKQILPGLIELVHQMAWTFPRKKTILYPAKLGNKAAAIGVAFHPRLD
jgi:glucokinase